MLSISVFLLSLAEYEYLYAYEYEIANKTCFTIIQISWMPRYRKCNQHHRTTRPPSEILNKYNRFVFHFQKFTLLIFMWEWDCAFTMRRNKPIYNRQAQLQFQYQEITYLPNNYTGLTSNFNAPTNRLQCLICLGSTGGSLSSFFNLYQDVPKNQKKIIKKSKVGLE